MSTVATAAVIERTLRDLLDLRAPKSLCPSEVARTLRTDRTDWRELMPDVRAAAVRLAHAGAVAITRGGVVLDPDALTGGPIRISKRE